MLEGAGCVKIKSIRFGRNLLRKKTIQRTRKEERRERSDKTAAADMDLSLQLQQKQILSQRMQQSVEILQMNTMALSEYIREVSEENPLLDWNMEDLGQEASLREERMLQRLEWLQESDEQNRSYYQTEADNEKEREDLRYGKKEAQSLREYLLFQIHILPVEKEKKCLMTFLAESTEESGYLESGALEAAMEKYGVSKEQAEEALSSLQALDPPGVGARDLRECLLIQLEQKGASQTAQQAVREYLEEIARNRLSHVAKKMHISLEELTAALREIKGCQPKPGSGFAGGGPVEYVVPDVLVERRNGELFVSVNNAVAPRLYINAAYQKMLREEPAGETREYILQKLRQAEWAVQCVNRRESTLLETARLIVEAQKDFFLEPGRRLKPLRMVDIAQQMQVHESTVSRAVKEKYLQCDQGVFLLADFFVKAMGESGTEVSTDDVRGRLEELIAAEDKKKPLSDRELAERLAAEGFSISRRTVAKYREAMGIPGAAGRKEY